MNKIDFQINKIQESVKEFLDGEPNFTRTGLETAVLAHNGTWFIIKIEKEMVSDDD